MKKCTHTFSLSALMALVVRATTARKRHDSANVTFEYRKTDRKSVVKTLGPPAFISKSEALSREYWAYHANPELPGIMCVSGGRMQIMRASKLRTSRTTANDYDVVFVFDRGGFMVDAHQVKPDV